MKKTYIDSSGNIKDPAEMNETYLINAHRRAKERAEKEPDEELHASNVEALEEEMIKRGLSL